MVKDVKKFMCSQFDCSKLDIFGIRSDSTDKTDELIEELLDKNEKSNAVYIEEIKSVILWSTLVGGGIVSIALFYRMSQ